MGLLARMLVMSACDTIGSIASAFSFLPVLKGAPGVPGAMGNQGTCNVQGCFIMAGGIGSTLYSCSLSIYVLATALRRRRVYLFLSTGFVANWAMENRTRVLC